MGKIYPLDWSIEDQMVSENRLVVGVDEVGRGPLAGPVVAAAVVLPRIESLPFRLTDSKKLSEIQKQKAFAWIKTEARWCIAAASVTEIDQINILHASLLAMARSLKPFEPDQHLALIDGNKLPKDLSLPAKTLVKGDSLSPSIAAASILAKVVRDRAMSKLDLRYPNFGWASNAGYPTPQHKQALVEMGPTPHHRRSFAPVAALIES